MRNTLARGSIFWVGVVAVVVLMALAGTESVLAGSHATAFVSNTSERTSGGTNATANELRAQTFTTGGSADGYALGSVGIEFGILPASFSEWTVSIYSVGSDDFPLNELYTLINPTGAAGDSQEAIFMAPSGTVLESDTNYAVVYVTSATLSPHGAVNNTDATSESVGSAGWSIGDFASYKTGEDPWSYDHLADYLPLKIAVYPPSDDPRLDGLVIEDSGGGHVPLDPDFDADAREYVAVVASDETSVTVRPWTHHGTSTFEYLAADFTTLADADEAAAGHQVTLGNGDTIVRVRVTSQVGNISRVYTVVVRKAIWDATLNIQDLGSGSLGCANENANNDRKCSTDTALTEDQFTFDGTGYSISVIREQESGELQLQSTGNWQSSSDRLTLHVGSQSFAFEDATTKETNKRYWSNANLGWTDGASVALKLSASPLSATGKPTITGTPEEGFTLTAGIGTIADEDGLPTTFPDDYDFQWVYVDVLDETDISGATSSTYILESGDVGKQVAVRVSFTDDDGNFELVTSDPYPSHPSAVSRATGTVPPDGCSKGRGYDWCATLTVGASSIGEADVYGYYNSVSIGNLSRINANVGPAEFYVERLYIYDGGDGKDFVLGVKGPGGSDIFMPRRTKLNVGGTIFTLNGDSETITPGVYEWSLPANFDLTESQKVNVSLKFPPAISIDDSTATVSDHFIMFDVRLTKKTSQSVKFKYNVTGGDAHGVGSKDKRLKHGWVNPYAYIYPGNKDQQIFIPLKGNVAENSTVSVKITHAELTGSGAHVFVADAEATGTIGAAPTTSFESGYQIAVTSTSANESGALRFNVHLTPSAPTLGEYVCFKYETIDSGADRGTATPGNIDREGNATPSNADYARTQGRAYFERDYGSGKSSWSSFGVPLHDDEIEDDGETVKVKLSEGHVCGDASRTIMFLRDTATGTINNSDPLPAEAFSVSDAEATEGVDPSLDFVVTLPAAMSETVTVDYATSDGTATAGSDYTAQSGTLTFTPGDTRMTISVPITNDSVDDDRETVNLTLSDASPSVAIHDGEAVGKINDYIREEILSSTMTTGEVYDDYGYINVGDEQRGSLSTSAFLVDGDTYTIKLIEADDWIYIGFDEALPVDFMLTVDGQELESSDASRSSLTYAEVYRWSAQDIYWGEGDQVKLIIHRKDLPTTEDAESVGPAITGWAHVGGTLTAHTSSIFDDDGLDDVSYSYQWIRNDGTEDSDISDATGSTYTLTHDDKGKTVKVKVTFKDDDDNDEERVSSATGTVVVATLTSDFRAIRSSHDGGRAFYFRISFSEELQNGSGRNIRRALSVSGGSVKLVRRVTVARDLYFIKVKPSGRGDVSISLEAFTGSCEDKDAICTSDGRKLSNREAETVSGPGV